MTNIDIANGLIFQALGVDKETFDDCLLSQKKVFLLQSLGVDIGYSYNWYIRGPYSPDLTSYIFANLDILKEQNLSEYKLSEDVKKKIDTVNGLSAKKPNSLSDPSWYELLASVFYIHKMWKKSVDEVFSSLSKYKPQYTKEQCSLALSVLKESNMVPSGNSVLG